MAAEKRTSISETYPVSTFSSRVSSTVSSNPPPLPQPQPASFFDRLRSGNSRRNTLGGNSSNQPNRNTDAVLATAEGENNLNQTPASTQSNAALRSILADTYAANTNSPLRQHKSLPVDTKNPFYTRNNKTGVAPTVSSFPEEWGPLGAAANDSDNHLNDDGDDDSRSPKPVEVAPVRSWNDFVLGSASKFQLPDVTNTTSSMRRAIINLLYYQTNYCVTIISVFLLTGLLNPREFTLGALTIGLCAAGYSRVSLQSIELRHLKQAHPMVSVGCILAVAFVGAYIFGSVLTFLSGILLPIFLIVIHAAVRKPNLDKLTMELPTLARTPMASLLEMLGFNVKRYLNIVVSAAVATAAAASFLQRSLDWGEFRRQLHLKLC